MRRAFRNYPIVIVRAATRRYPISAILKDGREVTISDPVQGYHISHYAERGWAYEPLTDSVEVPCRVNGGNLFFEGAGHGGDLISIFEGEYAELDVKDRVVLDVGANIGDTAVYFATIGARHVYALEPYPVPFEHAVRNVKRNAFDGVVDVIRAVCSGSSGMMVLDAGKVATSTTAAHASVTGISVRTVTIPELVKQLAIPQDSVLKVDCEGGEYSIFRCCDDDTLRQFSQIGVEYHYGVQDLAERFASAGFSVQVGSPKFSVRSLHEPAMEAGIIFARRTNPIGGTEK